MTEGMEQDKTKGHNVKLNSEDGLKGLGEYNRELSSILPKETFKREPTRLKYGVFFWVIICLCIYAILNFQLPWYFKLPLSVLMGICLGGSTFLGHEILHGSIVKNKNVQTLLGFIGFTPFLISPTYWRYWHNTLHHGNTQLLYKDPDAFPTMMVYKRSRFMQFVFPLSPGAQTLRSYFYFFYWFSFQAVLNQSYMRFGNKMWSKMDHTKVTIEFIVVLILASTYVYFVGSNDLVWLLLVPFLIQNYTVMSYISTNHNLSPYTKVNDPLVNSLNVSNHPIMEFLNLNFGYHIEHHLFPSMPGSKAKIVSAKLQELYPEKYRIMPKFEAIKLLYKTPRIYKNRDVLIHPISKKEFATLGRESILE